MKSFNRRRFLSHSLKAAVSLAVGSAELVYAKGKAQILGLHINKGSSNENIIYVELDQAAKHKTFRLSNPDRYVIDVKGAMAPKGPLLSKPTSLIKNVRYSQRKEDVRIVLDLFQKANVSIQSTTNQSSGKPSLKLTLEGKANPNVIASDDYRPADTNKTANTKTVTKSKGKDARILVIIDAGHGGRDPGAIGKARTKEKDITLSVARKLAAKLNRSSNYRAELTRKSDVFLPLRKRLQYANNKKADLFISIHADANNDKRVKGSHVYVLSENGASSEAAKILAKNENNVDYKYAGIKYDTSNKLLKSTLLDLSQTETIDNSIHAAESLLDSLAKVSRPLRRRVESAGFVVLKSPQIPSVLIETAFLSNPVEERRLRTSHYQNKLVNAIYKGIDNHLS